MPYEVEKEVAVKAVLEVSMLCRNIQHSLGGKLSVSKEDKTPVTIADFAAQALINMKLRERFPHIPVISEESSSLLRSTSGKPILERVMEEVQKICPGIGEDDILEAIDHGKREAAKLATFWTIDPIDGTQGFLRKEQYAVALALIVEGRVVLGVLGCPNLVTLPGGESAMGGTIYSAVAGEGAFMQEIGKKSESRIIVSSVYDPKLTTYLESVDPSHSSHTLTAKVAEVLGIKEKPVRMDGQVKYALLARGDAAIYIRYPVRKDYVEKVWDHAAGCVIVEEAGGRVTDFMGNELDFSSGTSTLNARGIVATNGVLHDAVLEAIRKSLLLLGL